MIIMRMIINIAVCERTCESIKVVCDVDRVPDAYRRYVKRKLHQKRKKKKKMKVKNTGRVRGLSRRGFGGTTI